MFEVNAKVTDSVIQQIMEGVDPRVAIDSALDEKAGYHKEKRIRDGKATTVNVKNTKRKVHHALTADQKKAIKKAHSAAANKKRAKSLKKGAKMGLYKESVDLVAEAEEEVAGLAIACPACANANLDVFVDPDGEETDGTVLVCPECGETFIVVSTSELEDDDKDDDEDDKAEDKDADKDEENADVAEIEVPQDESVEAPAVEASVSEDAVTEDAVCDDEKCDGENCDDTPAEEESGLFFEQE